MEKAVKQFKKFFIYFIIFTLVIVGAIITLFLVPLELNYSLSLVLILILVYLGGVVWFSPRLMYHSESILYFRLKQHQSPAIPIKHSPTSTVFYKKLAKSDFRPFYTTDGFTIFMRYVKNRKKPVTRRPMLMVYVIIHQDQVDYQDQHIVSQINRLEDSLYAQKKRITNYTIYIVKSGLTLSGEERKKCDHVTFSKTRLRSIVNINAFYEVKTKSLYFLYSNHFHPSAYYKFAVEELIMLVS